MCMVTQLYTGWATGNGACLSGLSGARTCSLPLTELRQMFDGPE